MSATLAKSEKVLVDKYGEAQRARAQRGLKQISEFWNDKDGNSAAFEDFVTANFAGDQATLDTMFNRYDALLEQYNGHMQEVGREFRTQAELDRGPILPFDDIFAGYDPSAHFIDDAFQNKMAFVVLLNFPLTTLDQRLTEGPNWSRRQWAEARLTQLFSKRIPADVNLEIANAGAESAKYIAEYNVWMHHLVNDKGERPTSALALGPVPAVKSPPTLVLPAGWFKPNRVLEVVGEKSYKVRLTDVIERGSDYERVAYEAT